MHPEKLIGIRRIVSFLFQAPEASVNAVIALKAPWNLLRCDWENYRCQKREIVGRVWPYIILGIGAGAAIHGYIPAGTMAKYMGKAWWSVPAMVLFGVPWYSNAAGVIPIVEALMGKGAALGTTLAFMMSVIAISFPEVVILRKVLKPKLIAVFIGVVAAGITIVGYIFNAIL